MRRKKAPPLPTHVGPYEYPPGSGEWWICYYITDSHGRHRRREKKGTEEAAKQAYPAYRKEAHARAWKSRREKGPRSPLPTRAGPYEYPPGSGEWWIGYNLTDSDGHRSFVREKKGTEEAAKQAYAAVEHKAHDKRVRNALELTNNPKHTAAREAGRQKARQSNADPVRRARREAQKSRNAAAMLGKHWTDEETEVVAQNLLQKILLRQLRRRPRRRRAGPDPLPADQTEWFSIGRRVAEKLPQSPSRAALIAARQAVSDELWQKEGRKVERDTVAQYHKRYKAHSKKKEQENMLHPV